MVIHNMAMLVSRVWLGKWHMSQNPEVQLNIFIGSTGVPDI